MGARSATVYVESGEIEGAIGDCLWEDWGGAKIGEVVEDRRGQLANG